MSQFKHPSEIKIFPNSEIYFSVNGELVKECYQTQNNDQIPLFELLPELSVFTRTQASGQFTLIKLVQLNQNSCVLFLTSSGRIYEDSPENSDSDPPPDAENAVFYKQDRIKVIESAEGAPIISFEHLSWETAVELVCHPERQPYCDLLENTLLFCYPIFLKAKKPHKCDCTTQLCCCQVLNTSQLQLIQLVSQLMIPSSDLTGNDLLFIHSEIRAWRESALDFLYRWLILRYPEDATKDVRDVLIKLWQRLCCLEGVVGTCTIEDLKTTFNYTNDHEISVGIMSQLTKLQNTITQLEDQLAQQYEEETRFKQTQQNQMTQIQSSCLSLMLFLDGGRTPEYFNFDRITCRIILENREMPKFYIRMNYCLTTTQQMNVKEYDRHIQMFQLLLLESPMDFALLIAHYFTESYLTITPKDIQKMAAGVDTPNVMQLIQRHNALCKLIQILIFGFSFEHITLITQKQFNNPLLQSFSLQKHDKMRVKLLQKLCHVVQLLFELKCIEGIFCIVSSLTTQLMSRIYTDELQQQLNEALMGQGPWLAEAGAKHLQEGLKSGSNIAKQFFQNGKQMYDGYVAFFSKGDYLFKPTRPLEENTFYTISDIEDIVRQSLNIQSKEFQNLQAYALKLGKPVNALELIDPKGNYSIYRNLLKLSIRDKQVFIPYMGVVRRDLVFTMDGAENYVDAPKKFMNYRKASTLFEYVLTYLSPQMNFLGYQHENAQVFLSQNVVARRIKDNSQDAMLIWLRSFSLTMGDAVDMWAMSEFAKPRRRQ
ncbi:RasGEF_domain-containing protein [Hexamita inflata]|uniref:RasGEF domain-containing protein n=1 Tax=Hexamita inflata TaxID=28002 RepID=A0AA86UP42_9EUKA|nr:RasGEF domain-containing protein [Hexamita inflata]